VPPADANALAEAIKVLYANPVQRAAMGKKGREKAEEYGMESMLNKIELLYEHLHYCPE